jgi:hypothetical protein
MSRASERVPSVNSLLEAFEEKIGYERVMIARGIMKNRIRPDAVKQTDSWIRSCYHEPSFHEKKMHALNVVLKMYGVEEILDSRGNLACEYLNAGDTYATTLLFYNGLYHIGTWGELVESMERGGARFS